MLDIHLSPVKLSFSFHLKPIVLSLSIKPLELKASFETKYFVFVVRNFPPPPKGGWGEPRIQIAANAAYQASFRNQVFCLLARKKFMKGRSVQTYMRTLMKFLTPPEGKRRRFRMKSKPILPLFQNIGVNGNGSATKLQSPPK